MRDELLICAEMDGGNLLRVFTNHKFNIIIVNKLRFIQLPHFEH
jgi:hypothetical protein